MLVTSVTSKFQATIPLEARKFLDIKSGDKVIFEINKASNTVILKKFSEKDYIATKLQNTAIKEDWLSAKDNNAFSNW